MQWLSRAFITGWFIHRNNRFFNVRPIHSIHTKNQTIDVKITLGILNNRLINRYVTVYDESLAFMTCAKTLRKKNLFKPHSHTSSSIYSV